MWFGWKTIPIDLQGYPSEVKKGWKASCFVFFIFVIYVGEVVKDEN